jgi:hypothetical protein
MPFKSKNRSYGYTPNRAPLRKIVGREQVSLGRTEDGMDVLVWREKLECGHLQRPVEDFIGETHAVRRRCKQCEKDLLKTSE